MPESVARTEMRFGTRLVRVYPAGPSAPAVYCSDYLESGEKVIEDVIPYADSVTGGAPSARHIAGYSMAGLFAIWSLFETEVFESAAAPSGSLWYPCFRDFFMEH